MDLNSDVGESFGSWTMGDDESIMRVVSSANVACGFHAGDPVVARATCAAAAREGVTVGAHVAYRDLAGFGRRFMDVSPAELTNDVIYQIGALQAMAAAAGTTVRYVKPHGALYNTIAKHEQQARAVVEAIRTVDESLPILVLPGSVIQREAEAAGLRAVVEAFADRAYNADGSLVSRRMEGSVIHDPEAIAARVVQMATDSTVETVDGQTITVDAESVCVHGDTPGAVAIATAVRAALEEAGVPVTSFL
ncbi:LamB/YcsF family protein [Georgenia thermotolerans]|uniref:5-oxoprolinase subunit A n=1 Tax=Georgenia thermotolerans TaxID=527326 RepID=A0A7J5URD9_9MICO|nr:5-oxoprolinase subunit PxpA [Georgenia thermotolerans]KAE8764694.1 5-oxoprolinase subunit PxpA [Georgenia thermotolerans]